MGAIYKTLPVHRLLTGLLLLALHPLQAQLQINELLAVNSTIAADPDFGEFSDFVELRNPTAAPVGLKGFTLSDDPADPGKWKLPDQPLAPGALLVVWTDGLDKYPGDTAFVPFKNAPATMTALHAAFRLSSTGEFLGLYGPDGDPVDEITYCTQANDVSFGRSVTHPADWLYFGEPTPGSANSIYGSALMETAGEPEFSLPEGFYPSAQTLRIGSQEPGAVVRFTFDGTTPRSDSPVINDSFNLNRNFCIKARVYVAGKMPGKVVTKSYFIHENTQLPVISISSNATNLYGFDFGILQNALKDREVPATIEYFEPDGARAFVAGVGVRVFGSSIYNLPQRPLSVRFKEKFGDELLKYPLFEGKPLPSYSAFLLRNGGNDYNMAYFRDGLAVHLIKGKMDIDYQDYKPCIVFVNGEYHGIYELRERLDEQYVGSNHEINSAQLDYLEDSLQVVSGDAFQFRDLMDFVQKNDLSDSVHYARVAAQIDINEFTNYLIQRSFIGYRIAENNNRYWRNRDDNGKWRWISADMEHAFGQLSGDNYADNTVEKLAGYSGELAEWSTLLFNRLLQNPAFRDGFIQRTAAYLNTLYSPAVTLAMTDSLKNILAPQMSRHIGRWNTPPSLQVWQNNVQFIKTFLQNRPQHLRRHLSELFGKPDSALVALHIVGAGKVLLSGVPFSADMQGHFFKNAEISLQAIPAPGYRFAGWIPFPPDATRLIPLGDTAFTAVFAPDNISIIPPLIDKDTTLSAAASPWYGLENIIVAAGARLRVEAGAVLLLNDGVSIQVKGGLQLDGAPDRRISVRPNPAPTARKGYYGQTGYWGAIVAESAADSLLLRYTDLRGGSFGPDRREQFAAISAKNSRLHLDHVTISEGKMPLVARGGSAYIGHSEFHTWVSCNGFISLYDMQAPLVEYCTFKGNRAVNTDGIDLKGITGGIVRYNQVSGFLGANCDGIDLGIYSQNNRIEYNIIHDCSDKGISIGSQSNAVVYRNLIYDCDLGVAVKDSLATAFIDQNTFYGNRHAVACYEKSALRGGGRAVVRNTILAASVESGVWADAKSEIAVSYSLSDREALSGTGNLQDDPALAHPSTGNFELAPVSPCIDAGDPFSPVDPDGSRADMGAYYTHTGAYGLTVHINEFMYHPPANYDTGDWLELYNRSNVPVDLGDWNIRQGLYRFVFPENTVLAPGAYLVVCQDSSKFHAFRPGLPVLGNLNFEFDNKSGKIALYDRDARLAHSVRYADFLPWPPLADGLGAGVELDQGREGNLPTDWRESYVLLGTPGRPNSQAPDVSRLFVNEILAVNTGGIADEQGDRDDWFELYNAGDDSLDVGGLCFTDDISVPCKWQLPLHHPEKTMLAPRSFLLLWADGEPEEGLLHANFRLSAGGETVAVYQRKNDGYAETERLIFSDQSADVSWGRYPDGSDEIVFMPPTPGASNLLTPVKTPTAGELRSFPNPFSQTLFIDATTLEKPWRLSLLNVLGQPVEHIGEGWSDLARLERGNLPAGVYTVVLYDGRGRRYVASVVAE